jgi:hypothetical protein
VNVTIEGCVSVLSDGIGIQRQCLAFGELPELVEGDVNKVVNVSSSSALPIHLSVSPSSRAAIAGNKVTALAAWKITITARQSGDATHIAAAEIISEVCIKPVKPTN